MMLYACVYVYVLILRGSKSHCIVQDKQTRVCRRDAICLYVCMCMYMHVNMCVYVCDGMHTCVMCMYVCVYMCVYMYDCMHTHAHMYVCVFLYVYVGSGERAARSMCG